VKNQAMEKNVPIRTCLTRSFLAVLFLIFFSSIGASEPVGTSFHQRIVSATNNLAGNTAISTDLRGDSSAGSDQQGYDPLAHWDWRNPLPLGKDLKSVAYGNGTFIASAPGANATIVSTDGINWQTRPIETCIGQTAVTFVNDTFFTLGGEGVCTSPDGITWTKRNLKDIKQFSTIAYGNGTFVALGRSKKDVGFILTSTDGINWTQYPRPRTDCAYPILMAYGNGTFVGFTGYEFVTSPDGITWTKRDKAGSMYITRVAYLNGVFIAVGYPALIETSQDGITWTERAISTRPGPQFYSLKDVTWHNGNFTVIASVFGEAVRYTSPDAVTWTEHPTDFDEYWDAVVTGNGLIVAVGANGAILTSPDGSDWTKRSSGSYNDFDAVAYGNDRFVAVGNYVAAASSDGIVWNTVAPPYWIKDIAYGNGAFVAVGGSGSSPHHKANILSSSDGIKWAERALIDSPYAFEHVIYGKGTFVAVGDGLIRTSSDGITWTKPPTEPVYYFDSLDYVGDGFLGVGSDPHHSYMFSSPDGIYWTATSTGRYYFWGAAYGNDTYVAIGVDSLSRVGTRVILTVNKDGSGSVRRWGNITTDLRKIIYAHGTFFLFGNVSGSLVATSTDGKKWTPRGPECSVFFNDITYGNGTFIGVANGGAILQSGNACPFTADPSGAAFGPRADNLTVGINTVEAGCPSPNMTANRDWITLSGFSFGGGSGSVNVSVAENDSFSSRTGVVFLGTGSFTVTQSGAQCTIASIDPSSASFGRNGGPGSFTANVTPSDCKWSVRGVPAWVKLTSGSQGMGSGVLTFTVKPNGGKKSRTGSMSVVLARGGAKSKFSVTQDAQ